MTRIFIHGGGVGGAGVGPACLIGETVPTTMPNIATSYSQWRTWLLSGRVNDYETHAPQSRTTTLHFSQSGNDLTGDGSLTTPYRTRAKAIVESGAAGGDVRLRFRGGDVWREADDWVITEDNVTIDSYGTGKATFTAFTEQYQGGWTLGAGDRYVRTEAQDIAWITEDGDELTDPFIRVESTAEVEATARSFFWDGSSLHINDSGDPNSNTYYGVVSNANNGVEFQGDGCRAENLIAMGYGASRATTATQAQPFTNRAGGTSLNVFKGCEGYISGSHAMAHNFPTGSGGKSLWINCKGGLTKYNAATETIFNTYSRDGDQETLFINCQVTHGTLKSSDWNYARDNVRGLGFFGHTGSAAKAGLTVIYGCSLSSGNTSAAVLAAMSDLTTLAENDFTACKFFIVNCTHEETGSGLSGGDYAELSIPSNGICYGSRFYAKRHNDNPAAWTNLQPANAHFINCILDIDVSHIANGTNAIYNTTSSNNRIYLYHTLTRLRNGAATSASRFMFDYDLVFSGAASGGGPSSNSKAINSVLSVELSTGNPNAYKWGLNNQSTHMKNNASFNVSDSAGLAKGYDQDAGHVVLASAYDVNSPPSALANAGSTDIQLSHDIDGKIRSGAPDIGPLAI